MNIVFRKVKVVDKYSKYNNQLVDIEVSNQRITKIEKDIDIQSGFLEEKLFENQNVSIGWMDMRVHSGVPGNEHLETFDSLQNAAANGGFTDIVVLPSTKPVLQTRDLIENLVNKGRLSKVNIHPLAPITNDFDGINLTEMIDLYHSGAVGFTDVSPLYNAKTLQLALEYSKTFDGRIFNQPLDKDLSKHKFVNEGIVSTTLGLPGIPVEAEELMIERDLKILEYTGGKLHFSLINTAKGIQKIKEAKLKGLNVTCDTAIHYLILADDHLEKFDSNYKVMPPLRCKEDVKALNKALNEGVIDVVVSDHTPQSVENKDVEFDKSSFGISGIDTLFPLLNTLNVEFTDYLIYNPYKITGINCPKLEVGEAAKFTFFNTNKDRMLDLNSFKSKSKNSPFIGSKVKGKILGIFNNNILYKNA